VIYLLYNIAVCDDDVMYLESIIAKIKKLFEDCNQIVQIDKFCDTSDLLQAIENGSSYKLIFLDVQFPQSNGIDVARKIKDKLLDVDFVFLSSIGDYAIDSFDVAPIYYIIKPEDDLKLMEAIKRFLCKHNLNKITIKTSNKVLSLEIDSIVYFEIMGHSILIHTTDNAEHELTGTFKALESIIPANEFARVHKSYIVNYKYITKIERYKITLHTGLTIPISKQKYSDLQNEFIEYASKKAIVF
jgi:DNA-binding LytR/AlgR family response regulator